MLGNLERLAILAGALGATAWAAAHIFSRMAWPWALLMVGYLGGFAAITLVAFLYRHPELEEE